MSTKQNKYKHAAVSRESETIDDGRAKGNKFFLKYIKYCVLKRNTKYITNTDKNCLAYFCSNNNKKKKTPRNSIHPYKYIYKKKISLYFILLS